MRARWCAAGFHKPGRLGPIPRPATIPAADLICAIGVGWFLGGDMALIRHHEERLVTDVAREHRLFVAVTALHLLRWLPWFADPYWWLGRVARWRR